MKRVTGAAAVAGMMIGGMCATPALAAKGDVLVRARAIVVAPNESSGGITPSLPSETVRVNDAVTPEVDATYMLSDNIGVEVIAATTKHSISGVSGVTGGIGKLASTWVLPPTATLQYHLAPGAKVRPYVGVGANWTIFYSSKPTAAFETAAGKTHVGLSDSVGWAAQAGVDFDLTPKVFLNLDVKYIDIRTTATIATANLGTQSVRVKLNPLVFGVGVGTRF